jgi:predicted Zn finger-like uncharacterized protein
MKITCQSCQSKYNVADEKVQGKIVKIRCRKCGATIVVQGNGGATTNGSGPAVGAASAAAGSDADGVQWHVNVGDAEPRTMTLGELVEAYNAGTVAQDTFIWTDGMDDWKPLSDVEAVVSALHAGTGAPAAAASAPALEEPSYSPVATSAGSAPMAAAAPVAVAMAAEPRRAAVVKREARARDLFGGGGGGVGTEEVQTSAPAVPQMMSASAVDDANSKMTGQRNENSVLFSLAVLTKDAGDRPEDAAPKPAAKNSDDSGLIDLKALAAKAESMRPAAHGDANAFASPLGMGGLAAPPLGGPLGLLGSPLGDAPQKSKLPVYIGAGAGVVLLLVLGIVIGVKVAGGGAAPEASAMASTAPTVTASATAEPSATASAAPTAEASATPSASVAVKHQAPAGGAYHPPAGGAKPAGAATAATGGGAATAAAATPPPAKKAGSDCGCNGDLMCLMKCSTH